MDHHNPYHPRHRHNVHGQPLDFWHSRPHRLRALAQHPARLFALIFGLLIIAAICVTFAASATTTHRFVLIADSEFSSNHLGPNWKVYDGHEGPCCPDTVWSAKHLILDGNLLNLVISKDPSVPSPNGWVAAGLSQGQSINQVYGEWEVRMRMGRGYGTAFALLLWPKTGWPPEVDFAEESTVQGATRDAMSATLHYGSKNSMIHRSLKVDLTKWHTIGVRWTPGRLLFLMDGATWATITSASVPNVPMHIAIQTEDGRKGSTSIEPNPSYTPSPVRLQLNWVKVWDYR